MGLEQRNFFEAGMMDNAVMSERPKLELEELDTLAAELKFAGMTEEVDITGTVVTISGGGVTSCYSLDLMTATGELLAEKSYDAFGGEHSWDDAQPRPLHSAEIIHAKRLEKLNTAMDAIANPQLIE